jgi:hypothetical protein
LYVSSLFLIFKIFKRFWTPKNCFLWLHDLISSNLDLTIEDKLIDFFSSDSDSVIFQIKRLLLTILWELNKGMVQYIKLLGF